MSLDRRSLLKAGAVVVLATTTARRARAAGPLLRRSVGSMAPNDKILDSYRKAITAMKALPVSDNRNWLNQANIHLNHCPHSNWYFLPWHRAYLVAFERICQELSGDHDFALPYWDWTADRKIPATFTSPTYNGQPNPLYDGTRTIPPSYSFPDNMVGPTVIAKILAEPNFQIFASSKPPGQNNTNPAQWQRANGTYGPLESNPHNRVHGTIGGDMGVFISPRDPIFWMHHCNIDRIWQEWNDAGHKNTSDALWDKFAFDNNFWEPNGTTPYNVAVSGLQDITKLGYTYKLRLVAFPFQNLFATLRIPLPGPIPEAALGAALAGEGGPSTIQVGVETPARLNTPLSTRVTLPQAAQQAVARIAPLDPANLTAEAVPVAPTRALAIIGDVEPPKTGNAEVRVFVNCDYLSPDTPPTDPSYAGTFTFFGGGHEAHGGGKLSFLIDLTPAITNLRGAQKPVTDRIDVQLMPVPLAGGPKENVEFKAGQISVAIF